MLTPGEWLRTHRFWDGFLNPTYVPGIVLRTGLCLVLAAGWLMLAAQRTRDAAARARIVGMLAPFSLLGILLAALGHLWWRSALPESVRILDSGASALLPSLIATARWLPFAAGAVLLLALFAWVAPRWHRWPTAILLLAAGAAALGGYERQREGLRKPFVIRDSMFANGVRVDQIETLNAEGILAASGWAAREGAGDELAMGHAVFRVVCASCHTRTGYLSIRRILAGADPDRVNGVLGLMHADGETWAAAHRAGSLRADPDELNYPFMPPMVGTEEESGALAAYLLHEVGVRVAQETGTPTRAGPDGSLAATTAAKGAR
jgi:mono/diheme cytochrome c family protein